MAYADVVLADAPYLYLTLDQTSGAFLDASGNGRHQSPAALDTAGRGHPGLVEASGKSIWVKAGINSVGGFDGSLATDFVVLPAGAGRTFECWFLLDPTPESSTASRLIMGAFTSGWWLQATITPDGNLSAGDSAYRVPVPMNVTDGRRHHLAVVFTADDCRTYLDGTLVATTARSTSTYTGANLYLGMDRTTGSGLGGWIDEFAVYTTALSADRVAAHHAAAAPVTNDRRLVGAYAETLTQPTTVPERRLVGAYAETLTAPTAPANRSLAATYAEVLIQNVPKMRSVSGTAVQVKRPDGTWAWVAARRQQQ